MVELLIAILIALGFSARSGSSVEELRAQDPAAYERAVQIQQAGTYKTIDGGGVVIVEIVGD